MKSIRIREAKPDDAGAIAGVHVASWRTTYPGIVPDAYLAVSMFESEKAVRGPSSTPPARHSHSLQRPRWASSLDSREGGVSAPATRSTEGSCRPCICSKAISGRRRPSAIRSGNGRLVEEGIASVLVWVLTENAQARRFYEKLGVELVCDQDIAIGGESLSEVAYGWRDVS